MWARRRGHFSPIAMHRVKIITRTQHKAGRVLVNMRIKICSHCSHCKLARSPARRVLQLDTTTPDAPLQTLRLDGSYCELR